MYLIIDIDRVMLIVYDIYITPKPSTNDLLVIQGPVPVPTRDNTGTKYSFLVAVGTLSMSWEILILYLIREIYSSYL